MELTQNLWERFGFRDNPFDTRALSLSTNALLPITKAFVGRDEESEESRVMTNFFRNPGGGRVVVEGDVGVGKTTFVNYHRYLWEKEAKDKLLTPASEISVFSTWTAQEFLISALGSLVNRFMLLKGEEWVHKHKLLSKIASLTHVYIEQNLQMSGNLTLFGFGGGGGFGKETQIHTPNVAIPQLLDYLNQLGDVVREEGFCGVILHFDNLELISYRDPEGLRRFFDEIRDLLQTPGFYFVFVAPTGFFQEIIVPLERVRSIFFGQPIYLPPLMLEDVLEVIHRRYELLATEPGRWIPPVSNELIEYLYKLYEGKIRFIMDSIGNIVSHMPESFPGTVPNDVACDVLFQLAEQKARALLSPREIDILLKASALGQFTNAKLAKASGVQKQNVNRALKKLSSLNLVYLDREAGGNVFYRIAEDMRILGKINAQENGG